MSDEKKKALREGLKVGLLVWVVIPGAILLIGAGLYFLVMRGVR